MWQIINTFLCAIIMVAGVLLFGRIVLGNKMSTSKSHFLIIFLLMCVMYTISSLFLFKTAKTIIIFLINIFSYKIIYNLSYKKSIFLSIMHMVILLVPDFIEMYFVTEIMGISMEYCFSSIAGSIISNLVVCFLLLILAIILKTPLRKMIDEDTSNTRKIIVISIITLLCIIVFFYEMGKSFVVNKNFWTYILVIIVLVSVLFNYIKQSIINNKFKIEYDQLLGFMTTYEEEIENQRTLRHETKNEFLAIRAKICDKEKESEIVNYIDEILGDTYAVKKEKYAKFGYLPANGIKGLCYFKVQKAEEKGIHVSINISKKIKESTIFDLDLKRQRDFAKILGVFIDNAIEASAESKDKELGIEAYSNIENEFRMIISNTYNNKIEEEKIGKESFSTKGKKRGHGLLLVNDIIKNNSIFETKREIKNDIYSQMIIVKKGFFEFEGT